MLYQIWEGLEPDRSGESTLVPADRAGEFLCRGLLGASPVLILQFEAATWDEACQRQYDHYGWGTYRPMDEAHGPG